jgi:NADPH-dependent 7-cyano-7-deazaguanine reductase QueF
LPAAPTLTKARFFNNQVTSLCPVTGQPDISSFVIDYESDQLRIEQKFLKRSYSPSESERCGVIRWVRGRAGARRCR